MLVLKALRDMKRLSVGPSSRWMHQVETKDPDMSALEVSRDQSGIFRPLSLN